MRDQPISLESFHTFGDLLKYLRRRERMTQLELSIAVGYSDTQITRLEKNQRRPDVAAIKALFVPALYIQDEPEIITRLLELAESARQVEAPAQGVAPYKGLLFFDESDTELFFGRENLTERLADRLAELSLNSPMRFLSVVGASGSGKSSLVRAGLTVVLKQAGWEVQIFTPGSNPLRNLESNLNSIDTENITRYLLLVDQFEEAFTLCREESERVLFIEKLLDLAQESSSSISIVIALRADFYSHCAQYPLLRLAVAAEQEYIGQMNREELRSAIEGPARKSGWDFEPGLVELLLTDIGAQGTGEPEPGALPLLSHALLATWERRRGRTLTLESYRASGGVRGAIAETAENVFKDQLNQTQQEMARNIFLRLTELGEGTEDTRRRATLNELARRSEDATQLRGVLHTLAEARLITLNEDSAEVSHEALIREWQRLHEWLTFDREGLVLHRHLTDASHEWARRGKDPSELYRGARLAQAREWAVDNEEKLNAKEQAFLTASIYQEEQEALELEAQRQRELQAVQKFAETERQSAMRLRWRNRIITAVAAAALALGVLAGVFGFNSSHNAQEAQTNLGLANQQRNAAQESQATAVAARGEAEQFSRQLARDAQVNQSLAFAAQSQLALQANNLDLALALAMEAVRIPDPPGQAQFALSEAAYAPGTIRIFTGHEAIIGSVAVSPDGRYGLSGDEKGVIYLWDLQSGAALHRLEGHTGWVSSLAFTPDGRQALSASLDKTLILWDLEKGESIRTIISHQDEVNVVAVSPNGRLAASGSGHLFDDDAPSNDSSVRLWNLQDGQEIQRFELFSGSITDLKFFPDSQRLAVGTDSDGFFVIDIKTGKFLTRSKEGENINRVALNPEGNTALFVINGDDIKSLNLENGEEADLPRDHNCPINVLEISPDGERLLTGSCNKIIEYDLKSRSEIRRIMMGAESLAYLPDGRSVLASVRDDTLRLLALTSGAEIGRLPAADDRVRGAAYPLDGQSIITDDWISLSRWDLATTKEIWRTPDGTNFWQIALSPDGRQVLTSDFYQTASLWDAATGELIRRLPNDDSVQGHTKDTWVDAVAFHPDGKFGLTGGQGADRSLIYWDLETGKPVWVFDTGPVHGVAISPDGRTALSAESKQSSDSDNVVKWWNLETGELIRVMTGHTNYVWSVAFVDNRRAISAADDGTLILWDLESGAAIHSFLGHSEGIKHIAISPDKRLVLSASRDGTAILWDVESGEPLRHYIGHNDELETIVWAPDGKEALTGGRDKQAIRWRIDANLPALLDWIAKNRYVRPLSCAEREAFRIEPLCEGGIAAGTDSIPTTAIYPNP